RKFFSHAYLRGTLFVDSYYGTSRVRSLALWLVALSIPIACVVGLLVMFAGAWLPLVALAGLFVALVLTMLIFGAINRAQRRALYSFAVYIVPFAMVFWAGIVRGLWFRRRGAGA